MKEKEHWMLEYQLSKIKFEKMQQVIQLLMLSTKVYIGKIN